MGEGKTQNAVLFMGLDGGGSYCRARIEDGAGNLLGEGRGGPANPVNGLAQSVASILCATDEALRRSGLTAEYRQRLVVGAGIAGLHLPSMTNAMASWQHPFKSLFLTTDLHGALLGAFDGGDGAVMVLGTGFSALAVKDGKKHALGGYGFPINATASGAWFGLEAVKAALLDHDGLGPKTAITANLLTQTSPLALAEQCKRGLATDFAPFAPVVFEHAQAGDALALSLVRQGAAFADNVIRRLLTVGVGQVALMGGIAKVIRPYLDASLQVHLLEPKHSPEQGALLLARNAYGQSAPLFEHTRSDYAQQA
ncbi:BadF/BadG/BcrA/BcrD ATPase family protein [Aliiglaciecola sp. CAU 1673]|uniref:BadF/BadG/BcrA/BcrD ATPase family protein n=1 Tax=Aliiglaciecola sp. CAU 1673 TaxID=3032595 RepID=UPI0023DC892B|nr:BadF/BadG/BcrA/BcrD ATPase family protein [Aliiglaciecola sp. CAU 1673]MDF2178605.1 BadF/BadG/BcrA/BcrD ATPase family protein [Aliiglaciecola sp. CAU 1673]